MKIVDGEIRNMDFYRGCTMQDEVPGFAGLERVLETYNRICYFSGFEYDAFKTMMRIGAYGRFGPYQRIARLMASELEWAGGVLQNQTIESRTTEFGEGTVDHVLMIGSTYSFGEQRVKMAAGYRCGVVFRTDHVHSHVGSIILDTGRADDDFDTACKCLETGTIIGLHRFMRRGLSSVSEALERK